MLYLPINGNKSEAWHIENNQWARQASGLRPPERPLYFTPSPSAEPAVAATTLGIGICSDASYGHRGHSTDEPWLSEPLTATRMVVPKRDICAFTLTPLGRLCLPMFYKATEMHMVAVLFGLYRISLYRKYLQLKMQPWRKKRKKYNLQVSKSTLYFTKQ